MRFRHTTTRTVSALAIGTLILFAGCDMDGQRRQDGEQPNGNQNGLFNGDQQPNGDTAQQGNGRNGAYEDTGGYGGGNSMRENEEGGMFGTTGPGDMSGAVSSVMADDSMLVVSDTLQINADTRIIQNGSDIPLDRLEDGSKISYEYEVKEGKKVLTRIEVQTPTRVSLRKRRK
jgi:hypothetical protein